MSAIALDAQIAADGGKYSSAYADILALALRQAMSASSDITLVRSADGSWNMSDVKTFMKNMGAVGTSNG